ncbi:MAG TPA: hypothetical protein VHB79_23290 [Polyangiaceae bacterium]|nr:hypothetical protein [Polyangiaceae bacterium]
MSLVVRPSPALLSFACLSLTAALAVACAADTADEPSAGGSSSSAQAGSTSTTAGGMASVAGTSGTVVPTGGTAAATGGTGTTTGGTAAAGAAPATGCAATDPMLVISDFETGKADVAMVGGRDGSWFLFNDGTGMQLPMKIANTPLAAEAGGACSSAFAFHTTGQNFTVWGFGLGTDLAPKIGMARTQYDLSKYKGIALRAKADKPASFRMSISDLGTAPEGMQCTDTMDKTNPARCGDYFGKEFSLTTDWQDLQMPWTEMTQRGWGLPIAAGFDAAHAYTFRLQVKGSAAAPANYDLWIDDVRLLP